MRELASQIDYSPVGLYEYFNSKEEIVQALSSEGHQRLSAYMRQVDENLPPAEYLLEIGLVYIDFALHNPEYYLLMFTNLPAEHRVEALLKEGSSFPKKPPPPATLAGRARPRRGAFGTVPGCAALRRPSQPV